MEKTKVKPLGENVLIETQEIKNKTATGIYLPQSSEKETPKEGRVIAVGESKEIKVKKGQVVIFRSYSGTDIKVKDKKYILIKNEDILAVME
jgi:chaperonin GroES